MNPFFYGFTKKVAKRQKFFEKSTHKRLIFFVVSFIIIKLSLRNAAVVKLADATDSKSVEGNLVSVRLRPAAPKRTYLERGRFFLVLSVGIEKIDYGQGAQNEMMKKRNFVALRRNAQSAYQRHKRERASVSYLERGRFFWC